MKLFLLLAVSVLSGQTATRSVQLNWTASATSGVTGYNVYRGTSTSGPFTKLGTTTGTAYTDNNATIGTTYTYQVTAITAPCSAGTTTACGESDPATTSVVIPPKPTSSVTVTVTIP